MKGQAVQGFVRSYGNPDPKLLLVGEAPGENEIETGVPFKGAVMALSLLLIA